jgi:hypothetical protein
MVGVDISRSCPPPISQMISQTMVLARKRGVTPFCEKLDVIEITGKKEALPSA